ncbi:MAG TPA: diaminobutyrate acetyltransferase [Gammaproteobacteria bacterium]|nr:diaminobutyrate acetyltransferase [Gammaproteobacteria bacterium]
MNREEDINKPELFLRAAKPEDGARMYAFVRDHGVLELNSAYCYMIMAKHFGPHCVIAEVADQADGAVGRRFAGFVLAYRPPAQPEDIFVWQIGVLPELRGRGIGRKMLGHLLTLPANRGVQYITATVARDNEPSRKLFRGLAEDMNVRCEESEFFSADAFPESHVAEDLFRIGTFDAGGATENL